MAVAALGAETRAEHRVAAGGVDEIAGAPALAVRRPRAASAPRRHPRPGTRSRARGSPPRPARRDSPRAAAEWRRSSSGGPHRRSRASCSSSPRSRNAASGDAPGRRTPRHAWRGRWPRSARRSRAAAAAAGTRATATRQCGSADDGTSRAARRDGRPPPAGRQQSIQPGPPPMTTTSASESLEVISRSPGRRLARGRALDESLRLVRLVVDLGAHLVGAAGYGMPGRARFPRDRMARRISSHARSAWPAAWELRATVWPSLRD